MPSATDPYGWEEIADPLGWKKIAEGRTAADPYGWAKIAANQAAAPAAGQQYPVTVDNAGYLGQQATAKATYDTDLSTNLYAQDVAKQQSARKFEDLNKTWTGQRASFNSPWLRRGMYNSGLRQKALTDLGSEQANALGDYNLANNAEQQGFVQKGAVIGNTYQGQLRSIDQQKTRDIYEQLAALAAAKGFQ